MKVISRVCVIIAAILLFSSAGPSFSFHTRRTNRTCISDMDCLPHHSSCYQRSVCMCNDGYVAINRTRNNNFECVKVAKGEGELCVHDLQCEVALGKRSGCRPFDKNDPAFGECHCLPNHHIVRGLCHPTAHIGDPCKVSDDCYLPTDDIVAYCDKSVCICPPGYHPSNDRIECIENKGLAGPCHADEDCKHPNTRCSLLGYCICQEEFVMNREKTACEARTPITQLGGHCSNDSQCNNFLKETVCDNFSKKCVCKDSAHQVNNTCYRTATLGDSCTERLECLVPSGIERVDCIGNICSCNLPYKRVLHDCLIDSAAFFRNHSHHHNSTASISHGFRLTWISSLILSAWSYSSH